jgi:hypothetical protein
MRPYAEQHKQGGTASPNADFSSSFWVSQLPTSKHQEQFRTRTGKQLLTNALNACDVLGIRHFRGGGLYTKGKHAVVSIEPEAMLAKPQGRAGHTLGVPASGV